MQEFFNLQTKNDHQIDSEMDTVNKIIFYFELHGENKRWNGIIFCQYTGNQKHSPCVCIFFLNQDESQMHLFSNTAFYFLKKIMLFLMMP